MKKVFLGLIVLVVLVGTIIFINKPLSSNDSKQNVQNNKEKPKQGFETLQKHTHLLFSLESLANLARNGRVKPAVAAVARMLGIRVIGQASEAGELDVLCKTRGEHGALERIVLELKEHGYTNGRLHISHCGNPAAAERLKHMVKAVFDGAKVDISECGGLCSYYAELGGLLVGYEDAEA